MIFVIDDDAVMAKCIARATGVEVKIFADGITAMDEIDQEMPELIFLDILLEGPDGFAFLNELLSYKDTARIPVVLVSSLDLRGRNFSMYGVVGVLNKETMRPEEIRGYVERYCQK